MGWINECFGTGAGLKLVSQQAASSVAGDSWCGSVWSAIASDPDAEVYCTIPVILDATADRSLYIGLRCQNPTTETTAYFLRIRYTSGAYYWSLLRVNAGVDSMLIDNTLIASPDHAAGDKFGLRVIGDSLQAWRNSGSGWATLGSAYDDSASPNKITAAGAIGILTNCDTVRVDDFAGGPVVPGTVITAAEAANGDDWSWFWDSGNWYTEPGSDGQVGVGRHATYRVGCGLRLTLDDAIPSGAVINTDVANTFLRLTPTITPVVDDVYIYVAESADAPQCTTAAERPSIDGGSTTTYPTVAEAAGSIRYNTAWPAVGTAFDIPVGPLIQYLVDTYSGLASGAHILFFIHGAAAEPDNIENGVATFEHATYAAASAQITYTGATPETLVMEDMVSAGTMDAIVLISHCVLVVAEMVSAGFMDTITFEEAPAAPVGLVVSPLYGMY